MVCNFWHQFPTQFSLLFQMVPFILLGMVAYLTITWLVETISTANQRALCWWFLKLPWREKIKVPSERAMKTESETGVKSDTPFCSRPPIEKTKSEYTVCHSNSLFPYTCGTHVMRKGSVIHICSVLKAIHFRLKLDFFPFLKNNNTSCWRNIW